ncbi:MAG TPA: hypothetical protein PKY82_21005 [Pyrinomonadaceae bacterium]|nr:hypothetical protein [Pyrinomonadaceae bacterium]
MKTKIRRRIISETKQIAVVTNTTAPNVFPCEICGESSNMVTPLVAARFSCLSTREIYRSIESGKTHFVEFSDRQLFVCLKTL